ncbi:glycosyltransferase [Vibrio cyclitrophicus]|uniref:glycosyltransferase n=1 Tax=Vibrio cyclitrophicus TaxID=47951 RepID=UPI0035A670DE
MNKVAVIMSVYKSDSLEHLKLAVNSILEQTFSDLNLFIFRDGVVPKEIDEYLSLINDKYDNVNLSISEKNEGLAKALNNLIDIVMTNGSFNYVARMDSDDICRPDRINRQVHFLELNRQVDLCGTSCKEFGASYALDEKHLPKSHDELLGFSITRCPFIHPSVVFRASVFEDGNRYPINTSLTEDMAFWFELLNGGYRFGNLNEVLLEYRLNEKTIERRKGWRKAFSEIRIRLKYMFLLNEFSFLNLLLIFSRLAFHLMPSSLVKLAYKKAR